MAFSIASGLRPERGLFTAIVAGFLISALGGSRVQIGGPTGAFVVIVAGIVAKFGYEGLAAVTILAGLLLIVMGLARLGTLVRYIPYPVVTGFTAGIAVVIFSSQVKDFLGLSLSPVPADFIERWRAYAQVWRTFNPWAFALASGTVAMISLWPKSWRKVPGPIAAVVLFSLAAYFFQLPVETIETRFGGIPRGLPSPSWPIISWESTKLLFPSAVTVAFLAAVESLLSAVVADGMIRSRHKPNMELVAQGVANILSPVFGGIPATGAIARTATNVRNGGRTPVAGMVHAVALLIILAAAGGLASHIPLSCLAGVLMVVCYHMSEWRSFRALLSAPREDVAVLLITFSLTVLIDLTVAVEVGFILAALLFMRKMAEVTRVRVWGGARDADGEEDAAPGPSVPPGTIVYSIQGSFFFGAANKLLDLARITDQGPRVLILDLSGVLHMDATGLHVLEQMLRDCRSAGIRLLVAGMRAQPLSAAEQSGFCDQLGRENLKDGVEQALRDSSEKKI
jgi:SulP family sulfate permease